MKDWGCPSVTPIVILLVIGQAIIEVVRHIGGMVKHG